MKFIKMNILISSFSHFLRNKKLFLLHFLTPSGSPSWRRSDVALKSPRRKGKLVCKAVTVITSSKYSEAKEIHFLIIHNFHHIDFFLRMFLPITQYEDGDKLHFETDRI